ncbi:caspase family protein [Flavisolibacter ginsenosidimutans]|uniref:Caspase family protein n=1 Tax=Flavisolibacter ginsenosidimutans TaxID=661481 RepID=A0A5B8UDP7_9BACT|nr:caspase family protein [Flavisolibacter ginsenosidimutans]QEC54797.1 caspase family protein [Flavisolibacter ginsenosidimutans]
MHKALKLIVAVCCLCQTFVHAQNQYAVLVGINDYYQAPGVKHEHSLHGCVNDANSIRELLLNRFGFKRSNIDSLYDSSATKANLLKAFHRSLAKCREGDAFVFYYSGHGAWMTNPYQTDSVKRRMSQGMVMSNLYAPNLECLFTDEDIKTVFNLFVDKKVKVTAIFDCCFSGLLPAGWTSDYWMAFPPPPEEKSMSLGNITYRTEKKKPVGCRVDSLGRTLDTLDTDGDGVPDCRDWEIASLPNVPVDSLGVMMQTISAEDYIKRTSNDPRFTKLSSDSSGFALAVNNDRAFNLSDALTVTYRPLAKRPFERANSGFLSLSAASDIELAAEITDEAGLRHGAFTKALLSLYKNNSSALPVADLLSKITDLMQKQGYAQHPTYHYERSRLTGNLVGVEQTKLSNTVTAKCVSVKNGIVTLDKGLYAGIAKGNLLKNTSVGNVTLQVTDATANTATAFDKNSRTRAGAVFQLVSRNSVSAPLVKLYIPQVSLSQPAFKTFLHKIIIPLSLRKDYADYHYSHLSAAGDVIVLTGTKTYKKYSNPTQVDDASKPYTIVLLPLPSYLTRPLKKMIAKNQSIQLVNRVDQADYVLFLNYVKEREGQPAGFVFYYHPPIEEHSWAVFSRDHLEVKPPEVFAKSLQALTQKLYELSTETVRYKSTNWINEN